MNLYNNSILKTELDDDGIFRIILNNPSKQNVLSEEMMANIQLALDDSSKDDKIRVLIDFSDWNHLKQFYEPSVIPPLDILAWRDLSPKNLEIGVARELK